MGGNKRKSERMCWLGKLSSHAKSATYKELKTTTETYQLRSFADSQCQNQKKHCSTADDSFYDELQSMDSSLIAICDKKIDRLAKEMT